jgi:hypothetical protein
MAKISAHRLVFFKDHSFVVGELLPSGSGDDAGGRLPSGGRCMIDSVYHNAAVQQVVVSVSHYPPGL